MYYISAYYRSVLSAALFVLLVGNAVCSSAQHKYEYLLDRSYAELVPLFDTAVFRVIIHLSEKESNEELEAIKKLAKANDDEQLYMEALVAGHYYTARNDLYKSYNEEIEALWELLKRAEKKKLRYHVILLRFELGGTYFYRAHDYDAAFTLFLTNYPAVIKTSSAEMPTKKSIILHTGNVYYNFADYANAKKYILIADTVGNSWRARVKIQCKNTLGLIYRYTEQYDSAKYYFEQSIDIAKAAGENIWVAIASGNIGITYYLQGKYREAIPLLKMDADACFAYGQGSYDNGINSLIKMADAYLHTGRPDSARLAVERGWKYADSMKDRLKHVPGLYEATADIYISSGEYKLAHKYRDSAEFYRDSLQRRDNTLQLARVQSKIKQEVHEKELQALNVEKDLIRNTRNALIAILVLLSIIAYLFINRQRLKHRANKAILTADKKLAENKLKNAVQELDNYTSRLQEKNALIEKSAHEIERLQGKLEASNHNKDYSESLQQLYASTILTDEEWDEFKLLFDKVHTGYLHRLKEKMPELSPADTRFIVLSKLNMTNKEMAAILGVQPDTIRTYKHRLRKKFGLSEDADIREFVDRI